MYRPRPRPATEADLFLGQRIRTYREHRGMTVLQLGRAVNQPYQQIEKYEAGLRIPAPVLEELGDVLDMRVHKRLIRQIIAARKREEATEEEQPELLAIYDEAFPLEDLE